MNRRRCCGAFWTRRICRALHLRRQGFTHLDPQICQDNQSPHIKPLYLNGGTRNHNDKCIIIISLSASTSARYGRLRLVEHRRLDRLAHNPSHGSIYGRVSPPMPRLPRLLQDPHDYDLSPHVLFDMHSQVIGERWEVPGMSSARSRVEVEMERGPG